MMGGDDSHHWNSAAPLGEQGGMAQKFAFWNVVLICLAGLCLGAVYALYNVMAMFITPLLWATLFGTIMFPIKRRISSALNDWLNELERDGKPLVVGMLSFPYNSTIKVMDGLIFHVRTKEVLMVSGVFVVLKLLSSGSFIALIGYLAKFHASMDDLLNLMKLKWVFPLMTLYLAAYLAWIFLHKEHPINKKLIRIVSVPLWLYSLSLVSNFFGPLNVIVFGTVSVLLILIASGFFDLENVDADNDAKSQDSIDAKINEECEYATSKQEERIDKALTGDYYIQVIFALCVLAFAVRHDWILVFFLLFFTVALLRQIGIVVGTHIGINDLFTSVWSSIYESLAAATHLTIAASMRKFFKLIFTSDRIFKKTFRSMVDDLSTIFVLSLLAFGSVFSFIFVILQLHNETILLTNMVSNVLAKEPEWLISARNYTENRFGPSEFNGFVEKGYQQGRSWLSSNIRSYIDVEEAEKANKLEKELIDLLDNVYRTWKTRSTVHGHTERHSLIDHLKSANSLETLKDEVKRIITENVGTVLQVLQSLWSVLSGNLNFLMGILFTFFGLLISFGLDVVHFLIELVVFSTALYYLLSFSNDVWLPLKWISEVTPHFSRGLHNEMVPLSINVAAAIENAIRGVFVLSLKMSTFYGLYTYFVHTLFDLHITFLPSLMSAIFAAVPIINPHFAGIFGVIELYFVRGSAAATLSFLVISLAPRVFADSAFYCELRGSHPYVTGLAIIGGLYWLGLQGAIIGPILLCCILVFIDVYATYMHA